MAEQDIPSKLLYITDLWPLDIALMAITCLSIISEDSVSLAKISLDASTLDTLFRILKCADEKLASKSLSVLLQISKTNQYIWQQIYINKDIETSVALLHHQPTYLRGPAVSTITQLCENSPKYELCSSPLILKILPLIVDLLIPSEHFLADKNESPAKEAAEACVFFLKVPTSCNSILKLDLTDKFVKLILHERHLGNWRSATLRYSIIALNILTKIFESDQEVCHKQDSNESEINFLWFEIIKSGHEHDIIDSIVTLLDVYIKNNSESFNDFEHFELYESAINLLGCSPKNFFKSKLVVFNRFVHLLNIIICNPESPENILTVCMISLENLIMDDSLSSSLISNGIIQSLSKLLQLIYNSVVTNISFVKISIKAMKLIGKMRNHLSDECNFDTILCSDVIPLLIRIFSDTQNLLPDPDHASIALTVSLESLSSLSNRSPIISKGIIAAKSDIIVDLISLVNFSENNNADIELLQPVKLERMTYVIEILSNVIAVDTKFQNIFESHPMFLKEFLHIVEDVKDSKKISLLGAFLHLISHIGYSIVTVPELIVPIVQLIKQSESNEKLENLKFVCLEILYHFASDRECAKKLLVENDDIVDILIEFIEAFKNDSKKITEATAASSILYNFSNLPHFYELKVNQRYAKFCVSLLVSMNEKSVIQHENSILISNILLSLINALSESETRKNFVKTTELVNIIRVIGTNSDIEIFPSHLAQKLFLNMKMGEKLVKSSPPATLNAKNSQIVNDEVTVPPIIQETILQQHAATRSKHQIPSKSATPKQSNMTDDSNECFQPYIVDFQPEYKPKKTETPTTSNHMLPPPSKSRLPTYYESVKAGVIRKNTTDSQFNREIYNSSKSFGREPKHSHKQISYPTLSPSVEKSTPVSWDCPACTFINKISSNKCEMCETAKPI